MMKKMQSLVASLALMVSGAASAATPVTIFSYVLDGNTSRIILDGTVMPVANAEALLSTSLGTFASYCIDLFEDIPESGVPDSSYMFDSYVNDRISRLFAVSGFIGNNQALNQVDTIVEKAAMQYAIWEAIYDFPPSNLYGGRFQIDSSPRPDVPIQAASYLAAADALTPGSYVTNNLYIFHSRTGQDMVTLVPTPVPEPSTYALMLAGLCGMAFAARRKSPRRH